MSERIKSGSARAKAARQELADLRDEFAAKEAAKQDEIARLDLWGFYDDVEAEPGSLTYDEYLAQRPDGSEAAVTRSNAGLYRSGTTGRFISQADYLARQGDSAEHHREHMEANDPTQDYVTIDMKVLIDKYAQAETADDRTTASDMLEAIDAKVAGFASKHSLEKDQIDQMYDRIMVLAQAMAGQSGPNKVDNLSDMNQAEPAVKPGKVDDLSDLDGKTTHNRVDDLSDLVVPTEPGKVDDLRDLQVAATSGKVDDLRDLGGIAEPGKVDDLRDLDKTKTTVANSRGKVDDLRDLGETAQRGKVDDLRDLDRGRSRIKKVGNFLRNANFKAAAVLSVAMFRAGQWLGEQEARPGESAKDFETRRNNNAGQKVAVGALAVGATIATWYWFDKQDGSSMFSWFSNNWGDNNQEAPTPTKSPTGAGTNNGDIIPSPADNLDPVAIPEVDAGSTDIETGVNDTSAVVVVEKAMPGLDSGSYVYPWDWASDKFGSQNSRQVLDTLVSQTDGACWHRLGDGVDTNDWISINGRSDSRYVIEQLSEVANNNPELVQSMYRG